EALAAAREQILQRPVVTMAVGAGGIDRRDQGPVLIIPGPSGVDRCCRHLGSFPRTAPQDAPDPRLSVNCVSECFVSRSAGAAVSVSTTPSPCSGEPGQRAHSGAGPAGASGSGAPLRSYRPELSRRWLPSRWVSPLPIVSIRANMVVGPTKRIPRRLS